MVLQEGCLVGQLAVMLFVPGCMCCANTKPICLCLFMVATRSHAVCSWLQVRRQHLGQLSVDHDEQVLRLKVCAACCKSGRG